MSVMGDMYEANIREKVCQPIYWSSKWMCIGKCACVCFLIFKRTQFNMQGKLGGSFSTNTLKLPPQILNPKSSLCVCG